MQSRRMVSSMLLVSALALAACSGDGSPLLGESTTTAPGSGGPDQSTGTGDGDTGTTTVTPGPDSATGSAGDASRPLPIQEGLATFDSYVWHMEFATSGPTPDELTQMSADWSFDSAADARLITTTNTVSGPDYEQPETTTEDAYTVGNESCTFDGETWTYQEITPQQREVLDVTRNLVDISIIPADPVEVGPEEVAGLPSTHYSFTLPGLGRDSGALVIANQIDYWLSDEGRVLVKYRAEVETRSGPETDPNAEVYRFEASAELISADQPVTISLPAECLAEKPPEDGGDTADTTTTTEADTTTTTEAATTTTSTTIEDAGGALPPAPPYEVYEDVTDDTGRIRVSVPAAWTDRATGSWTRDGNPIGPGLAVAPDIDAFVRTWTVPGVFIGGTTELGTDLAAILDAETSSACTYVGRDTYSDPYYTGLIDTWVDCGAADAMWEVLAVAPDDASGMVIVLQIQSTSQADREAAEEILRTFVVDSP